jgi:drug/metabolite transporter (DMT)-like permease
MTKPPPGSPAELRRATVALMVLSLIWGYNWIAMKVALDYATPIDAAAVRFALGALALLPAAHLMGYGLLIPRKEWRLVGILSVSLAANFAFTLTALDLGGVGKTAVLVYTMPFWVVLFARIFLRERMRNLQWIAVILALVGLLVLVDVTRLAGWLPSLLAVLAGLSWAASVVFIKSIQGKIKTHLMTLTVWQMACCAGVLWLCGTVLGTPPIRWTWAFAASIGFSAILGSAFSWMLFYYALARLPAGMAGLGTLATPVIGVAAAWVHFGERPSGQDAVGMLLIAMGLLLLAVPGYTSKPAET